MGPVEPLWDGDEVSPERTWDQWKYYGIEMWYPLGCGQRNKLKLLPYPTLRMRAVIIYRCSSKFLLNLKHFLRSKDQGFIC